MMARRVGLATLAAALLLFPAGDAIAQLSSAIHNTGARDGSAQMGRGAAVPAPAINFQEALQRARANSTSLQAALTDTQLARQDRVQARAAMLPAVSYTTSYLYTEGNGTPTGVFVANNGVHEYLAQGNAHEDISLGRVAEYCRTKAALALSRAREEIAARGLLLTVTQDYYGLILAERQTANAQAAAGEARHFVDLSEILERGGEVAHSDVIKAQLQLNDREQGLREAQLGAAQAKLALSVLLFPVFTQDFTVVDDLASAPPLPPFPETEALAARNNADIKAAVASLRAANEAVTVARSGHIPTLSLDYWYGIDAPQFATRTDGFHNLGYAAQATLNVPIFDWGAIRSKVKQAEFRRTLARKTLNETERTALANLRSFWSEADTARAQVELSRKSTGLAADSLRLTNLRYEAGDASALEVVDAQNSLVQARNAGAAAEARYRIALSNLQTLTGAF